MLLRKLLEKFTNLLYIYNQIKHKKNQYTHYLFIKIV